MIEHRADRSQWGHGPWDDEPDRVEFEHAGYRCLLKRGGAGAWCGYVGVPEGHPWHGRRYSEVDADVHGGVTYAGECDHASGICHHPPPGEADSLYWIGFDTAHGGDSPPLTSSVPEWAAIGGVYRDMAYTRSQTELLAQQAREHSCAQFRKQ